MKGILLVSHGDYAEAMKQSVEMIVGVQKNIFTLGIKADESGDDFFENLNKFDTVFNLYDEVIIFCDLLGGTPCNNVIKKYYFDKKFKIVSGVNFQMLLSAILYLDKDIEYFMNDGKNGIVDVKKFCDDSDVNE